MRSRRLDFRHVAAGKSLPCQFGGLAEAHNSGNILGSGAARALVTSAVKHGREQRSAPNVERANALGRMQLMAGERQQIGLEAADLNGNLARGLYRVGVEVDVGFRSDSPDLLNGLQHAGFVVCHHDGNQPGTGAQGFADVFRVNQAAPVHRNVGYFAAFALQMLAGVQDRVMLDGRADHVVARPGQPEEGQIVGFGAAAGKDNLRRASPQQRGYRFAGALHRRPGVLAVVVDRRGIAELFREVRQHRLQDGREHRAAGVIVEVNSAHKLSGSIVSASQRLRGSRKGFGLGVLGSGGFGFKAGFSARSPVGIQALPRGITAKFPANFYNGGVKTWDAVIIGGGIIGVSLALELRRHGADVLVVDRTEPGREASSAAAGMLADMDPENPPALRDLAIASGKLYAEFVHQLEDESGVQVDLRSEGTLLLGEHGGAAYPPGERLNRLTLEQVARLEPALSCGLPVCLLPERSLDPRLLMAAALKTAKHRGIEVAFGDPVTELLLDGDRATGVRTERTHFSAPVVVNCAGAWAGEIRPQPLPARPSKARCWR